MADVSVDATISASTGRVMRGVVVKDASNIYAFYIDSGGNNGFGKSTDGGATWGPITNIGGVTTQVLMFGMIDGPQAITGH